MEIPKTLWLKHNMKPELFKRCQFFDLPDFLTYRATGFNRRSCCSVACKCSFVPTKGGWQPEFFKKIGLEEFVENEFSQLGKEEVLTAGMPIGNGLCKKAAEEMGLLEGTPVGSGVIDASVSSAYMKSWMHRLRCPAQIRWLAGHRRREVQG